MDNSVNNWLLYPQLCFEKCEMRNVQIIPTDLISHLS